MDAPHLKNNPFGLGFVQTRIINGACWAVDGDGYRLSEEARLANLNRKGEA